MTIMMNFYRVLGHISRPIDDSQFGISATTMATTYMELAHGLAFDETTDTTRISNRIDLTPPHLLGPETSKEVDPEITSDLTTFNDFDDFHGALFDRDLGPLGVFRTAFEVYYVDENDIEQMVTLGPTFLKRMDIKIWRTDVPVYSDIDTLRMYTVMGYFHFN